jgi:hypothetical protein
VGYLPHDYHLSYVSPERDMDLLRHISVVGKVLLLNDA